MERFTGRSFLASFIFALCTTVSAMASPGDVVIDLLPETPVFAQDFADAIAIEGNLVVIGAENTDIGSVISAGSVFLFDATTGQQLRQITPAGPPAPRAFGTSVDIGGGRIVVGAEDENGNTGAAFVFDSNGNQLFKLLASDGAANHSFGEVVAIDGNFALVGAANASGANGRGQVYMFDLTNAAPGSTLMGTPFQPTDLPSPTSAEFGSVIDMDGGRAIVAVDRVGFGGAAYVYDTSLNLVRKFLPPTDLNTKMPVPGFGRAVGIEGDVALIGATLADNRVDENNPNHYGRAYLYQVSTGALLHELTPSDSTPGDLFGESVAIDGNLAVVHARHEDVLGTINTAYVFDVSTGNQLLQLNAPGLVAGDEVFEAFAVHAGRVVAGVEGYDGGAVDSGKAIVFDALFGDYNRDGHVDSADYTVWRNSSGTNVARFEGADGNGDMLVDHNDYRLWRAMYGTHAPQTAGSGGLAGAGLVVPEPSTFAIACLTMALACLSRRRVADSGANWG